MLRRAFPVILLSLIAVLPALGDDGIHFRVDRESLPFDAVDADASQRYWGVHQGAGYRMEVPANWQGTLVVYAHAFRGNDLSELTVTNPPSREAILAGGHAWAASSFSRNRYDVAAGVEDSLALIQVFKERVDAPDSVVIMGHDLGGHVAAVSAQLYPDTYDGALPLCAPLGDTAWFSYLLDFNLVAQALTGLEARFPDLTFQQRTREELLRRLGEDWPGQRNRQGDQLRQVLLHASGGPRPLFDEALSAWGQRLFDFGHMDGTVAGVAGGSVIDNRDTVYRLGRQKELSPEEQRLNDRVLRVEREPLTRRGSPLDHVPAVTGDIAIPVLTLHTVGDLFVPLSMQQTYAQRVSAAGNGEWLLQRVVRDVGHCTFSPREEARALNDLLQWIETGMRPGGVDVSDPDAVGSPSFGCGFTEPERPGLPACAL